MAYTINWHSHNEGVVAACALMELRVGSKGLGVCIKGLDVCVKELDTTLNIWNR